jgi:branched-chain amino acid transport system permease protein
MGSLSGAFAAAMILGVVEAIALAFLPLDWAPLVFYGVLFGVLIVRPQGLRGSVARESL